MVTLVKPVLLNALEPMLVTLSGMTMLVKPVQSRNASLPMLVTLLPIVTFVKLVQPWNAKLPIELTVVLGNTIEIIRCIPSGTVAGVVPVLNAPFEILVLADRSRATFLPAVCSAASICLKPSVELIVPKSICTGRGIGSTICDEMYSARVPERVSVWLAL